jgi:chromosome segregation ATPase
VKLTSQLSDTVSQLSQIQLELAGYKKKELELNQKLEHFMSTNEQQKSDITSLRAQQHGTYIHYYYFTLHNLYLRLNLKFLFHIYNM